ncbi:MAG: VWA domain-containing protein [Acidobacteriota bacterium]
MGKHIEFIFVRFDLAVLALLISGILLQPAAAQQSSDKPLESMAMTGLDISVPKGPTLAERLGSRKIGSTASPSRQEVSTLPGITYLGSASTPSSAQSFALNGTLAYVCGTNEVTTFDISNAQSPIAVGTAVSTQINNTGLISCNVQRNTLAIFSDQVNSNIGNNPGFVAFSLSNPSNPQLIANTAISKRFFQAPLFIGNIAYIPTAAITFAFSAWDNQFGDLIAVDTTNFSAPTIVGTLMQPQIHPQFGGANPVFGISQADANAVYIGGTTSTSNMNNGVGRIQVVDTSVPNAMKVIRQVTIPGTVHFGAPLVQRSTAVGIGNQGGYVGAFSANPVSTGNIIVATFDVSDRRTPVLLATQTTSFSVGAGAGATRIGNNLFAFAGVVDASNNPVLLIVDTTDPAKPFIQGYPIPQAFTSMQAVGSVLYATLGSGGFATFSIPGLNTPTFSCPLSTSAVLVFDAGPNVNAQLFTTAKNAAKSFINSLNLSPDQIGVVSAAATATLLQQLTTVGLAAKTSVDGISLSHTSHLGAAITAAQSELASTRRTSGSTPVIVIVSDGSDRAAPNATATISAAAAAKASGVRILVVQYGSQTPVPMMQTIASSASDFYLVP